MALAVASLQKLTEMKMPDVLKPGIISKDKVHVVSSTKNMEPTCNIDSIKVLVIIAKQVRLLLFVFW